MIKCGKCGNRHNDRRCPVCGHTEPKAGRDQLCDYTTNGYRCKMPGSFIVGRNKAGDPSDRLCTFHHAVRNGLDYTREAFNAWHEGKVIQAGKMRAATIRMYEKGQSGELKDAGIKIPECVRADIDSPVVQELIDLNTKDVWAQPSGKVWEMVSGGNAAERTMEW